MNAQDIFLVVGLVSTALFIVKTVLKFIGVDLDLEFDFDSDSSDAFEFISLQSILGFVMGFSWTSYCYPSQVMLALGVGVLSGSTMLLVQNFVKGLQEQPRVEQLKHLVGRTGKVYLVYPSTLHLVDISVTFNGKMDIVSAMCLDECKTGDIIEVTNVENNIVTVKKKGI